jgi:L-2-hydroxycarboxylate dehydrogenase (NAD+)
MSMINRGKIRVAARNNQKIPEGVALDINGNQQQMLKKL